MGKIRKIKHFLYLVLLDVVTVNLYDRFRRPKGEWYYTREGYAFCSECGKFPLDGNGSDFYCGYCGAKMKNPSL